MSDAESKLFLDTVRAAYRDVNPDISANAENLCRRLADGLYARGARIQIGAPQPTKSIYIHQSLDPLGNILWTCRRWNAAMGVNSRAPIGRHFSEYIDAGSYQMIQEFAWPELIREGRISDTPVVLITATHECLAAFWKTEILRDERGGFLRTFGKLKVQIPAALARLATA